MKSKQSFIKLRDKLKKYNKEYYNSNPSIDDSKYDDLKKKYDYLLSNMDKLIRTNNHSLLFQYGNLNKNMLF